MAYQPKSYRKFLAGTVSAAVVASAIAPVASAASFTDVAGSVHADDIATLVAKGYIKGYGDNTFKPNKSLTRGEAAIIFSRILKDAGVKAPEQGAGFPDVPASNAELAEAVAIVKAAGVMSGDEKGNFNPNATITREQMAKVVVEAFKLTKPANHTTKVTDLDKAGAWAREYIQTLEANGVTKNTEFMPKQSVTRGQFASFVVRAMNVGVTAAHITGVTVVDLNTLEVTFNGELKEVKKEDFAIQGVEIESVSIKAAAAAEAKTTVVVIKTKTALEEGKSYSVSYKGQTTDKTKVDVPVLKVEAVSAPSAKTLKITGTGLQFLKSEDVTVAGNKVLSVVPDTDGKAATVSLENKLAPNANTTVSVKIKGEKKDFTTKFEYKVTSVSIEPQTFDDDRAGQRVKFKVNGEDADVDYLKLAGYSVAFVAKKADGTAANGFFDGSSTNTSSTGVVAHPVTKGDYTVEVQVTRAGEALVTDTANIKVVNLDTEATEVNSVTFYNFGIDKTDDSSSAYNVSLSDDDYVMNSTTLVAGEKAKVYKVEATVAGEKVVVSSNAFEVKTSNPAVVSVSNGVLTAESAGTATITIKVGEVTKTFNFTVTNVARKLSKVTVDPASVSIVKGYQKTVTVKTLDQYGDPYRVNQVADLVEVVPIAGSNDIVTFTDFTTDTPNSIGKVSVSLTGNAAGSGTFYFKDKDGNVIGSFYVNVSAVDNTGSKKLEVISKAPASTDNTLDLQSDKTVTYQLSRYNTEGIYMDPIELQNYEIEVVDGTVAKAQFVDVNGSTTGSSTSATLNAKIVGTSGDYGFVITGLKAGTTDVLLKDTASGKVEKITITVVNNPIKINTVNFKTVPTVDYVGAKINYEDVLDVTYSNEDDIVNGITLSKSTLHKVRISEDTGTEGLLYLDVDGDASYTSGTDIGLGMLKLKLTADSTLVGTVPTDAVVGYTTVNGDKGKKGTLLFKVLTDVTGSDETTSIAATAVTVEVK
ncbi:MULTISPECIES: S-layer homology domain-containing protein [Anoxybacillus]|uniref:S-layer homology domain-containing protein n=1 Tax=Anoxybacillus gonensis TaxID=198467 RepID=A0AAW7TJY7_9BACL|nr:MULTISPECIES: S-layer homology domain-containing protein [Anoxybacillus]MBW9218546.1 S-layer homology domain-containing protein [Anoxybacillus sp. ST70]MDO0878397.1 S-layer homology domain-containing protein [Anoxybacillus gonensis]